MAQITPKAETIIEDGWYKASIGETEMKETTFGDRLMIPFDVEADDQVVDITAFLKISDHPKSNVVKWGKSLFGDRPFNTDEFDGVGCEVFVEEGEDKDGSPKNFIRKVRPLKGKKAQKAEKPGGETGDPDLDQMPF